MSKRGLEVGARVLVGRSGDNKWTGTVREMKKLPIKGENDWVFLIHRDMNRTGREREVWVQDRNVRRITAVLSSLMDGKIVVVPPKRITQTAETIQPRPD